MNHDFKIFNPIILTVLENNFSIFMKARGTKDTVGQRMFFPSANIIDRRNPDI